MVATAAEKKLLIDGEWVETGDWVEVRSPYSGELVSRVAKAGAEETRRAIDAAERAMRDPLPAHKRAEILVRVAGQLGRGAGTQPHGPAQRLQQGGLVAVALVGPVVQHGDPGAELQQSVGRGETGDADAGDDHVNLRPRRGAVGLRQPGDTHVPETHSA